MSREMGWQKAWGLRQVIAHDGLVPPKTLSVGFVGVPPGSVIQPAVGTFPNYSIRHAAFGTNPRWADLGGGIYAFVVDQYVNAIQMFWVIQPDGASYLMVADPWTAPRARCLPGAMLLDGTSVVRGAQIIPEEIIS